MPGAEQVPVDSEALIELGALGLKVGKGVQHGQLLAGVEERLMFVRSVEVDQPLPQVCQVLECGGGTIDKLAVGAGNRECSFDEELVGFAGFQPPLG